MIRASVEDHEKRMRTWKGWLDVLWIVPLALLALPFAYLFRFYERWRNDGCVKCGHVHRGPLICSRDAHGKKGTRVCAG